MPFKATPNLIGKASPEETRAIIDRVRHFFPELVDQPKIIYTEKKKVQLENDESIELKEYHLDNNGSDEFFSFAIHEEDGKQNLLIFWGAKGGWLTKKSTEKKNTDI